MLLAEVLLDEVVEDVDVCYQESAKISSHFYCTYFGFLVIIIVVIVIAF